jgi:hypothetical protein
LSDEETAVIKTTIDPTFHNYGMLGQRGFYHSGFWEKAETNSRLRKLRGAP